jgi:hypothetical protein
MLLRPRPLRPRASTNFGVARRVWLADAQQMHICATIWELEFKLEFWSRRTSRRGSNHNRDKEDCNQPLDAYPFSQCRYPRLVAVALRSVSSCNPQVYRAIEFVDYTSLLKAMQRSAIPSNFMTFTVCLLRKDPTLAPTRSWQTPPAKDGPPKGFFRNKGAATRR